MLDEVGKLFARKPPRTPIFQQMHDLIKKNPIRRFQHPGANVYARRTSMSQKSVWK